MEVVPPRYAPREGRPVLVNAVGEKLQTWFAEVLQEPIPEHMTDLIRRIEAEHSATDLTTQPTSPPFESEPDTPERPPRPRAR
jgi:Anti-sigma factor NepR